MGFHEHLTEFVGKSVYDYRVGLPPETQPDPSTSIPRLRIEYEGEHENAIELLLDLLQQPIADRLTGLVLGTWLSSDAMFEQGPSEVLDALCAAAPQLPNLTALFIGDIQQEECEVSWIYQTDVSPLWTAFPRLETIYIRGSNGLTLGNLQHDHLKTLVIQCGGLPKSILEEIGKSQMPQLEHLEIYLGEEHYGWDGAADDLAPILSGGLFPKLVYLGLKDSVIQDDVAKAVAQSPLLDRIKVLDLSLGSMTDEGGNALLQCEAIRKLEKLNLCHHFMSDAVTQALAALPIEVDVSEQLAEDTYGDETYRYIAVSE